MYRGSREAAKLTRLAPLLHVLAQRIVHSSLVSITLGFEPGEHVGVDTDADRLFLPLAGDEMIVASEGDP